MGLDTERVRHPYFDAEKTKHFLLALHTIIQRSYMNDSYLARLLELPSKHSTMHIMRRVYAKKSDLLKDALRDPAMS